MGKETKKETHIVRKTKTERVSVEVEELEEKEVEVLICDLCGQRDGPEYAEDFHTIVDNPRIIGISGGKTSEIADCIGDSIQTNNYSLYDRAKLVADREIILCPHCYRNLFNDLTD